MMSNLKSNNDAVSKIKYLSCSFFIGIGLFNLVITWVQDSDYYQRDFILLVLLSLPLLVNKRLFFLCYGVVASTISLLVFLFYLIGRLQSIDLHSVVFYLLGCTFYLIILTASLGFIYVGTFTKNTTKFRLI